MKSSDDYCEDCGEPAHACWCETEPSYAGMTERQRLALETQCGPYCTPDDHLRYADRGKCSLCGRNLGPSNEQSPSVDAKEKPMP